VQKRSPAFPPGSVHPIRMEFVSSHPTCLTGATAAVTCNVSPACRISRRAIIMRADARGVVADAHVLPVKFAAVVRQHDKQRAAPSGGHYFAPPSSSVMTSLRLTCFSKARTILAVSRRSSARSRVARFSILSARIVIRYEKTALSLASMLLLVAAMIWLR
jgi:hypothetical protein